jgi:hypothetical protein
MAIPAPKTKQSRMNWSKGEPFVKLERALNEWREKNGASRDNAKTITLNAFAKMNGIPHSTLYKYVSGERILGGATRGGNKPPAGNNAVVKRKRKSRAKKVPPAMHVNLKSHVHRARKTALVAKLARVDKTTIGPSKNRRFSKTIVGRSPHSEISTDWNSIKQLLTPEELQAWRGEKLKDKARRERQQKRQLASRAMSS